MHAQDATEIDGGMEICNLVVTKIMHERGSLDIHETSEEFSIFKVDHNTFITFQLIQLLFLDM